MPTDVTFTRFFADLPDPRVDWNSTVISHAISSPVLLLVNTNLLCFEIDTSVQKFKDWNHWI